MGFCSKTMEILVGLRFCIQTMGILGGFCSITMEMIVGVCSKILERTLRFEAHLRDELYHATKHGQL